MLFDLGLIEASFAARYGVRLAKCDMSVREFLALLGGLDGDTPLGRVVRVRLESGAEALKRMTAAERRVRREWAGFKRGKLKSGVGDLAGLQRALAGAFGS